MRRALARGMLFWLALAGAGAAPFAIAADTFDINEGELHFLTEPPAEPPHRHTKRLRVTPDSLKSGWVQAEQCHYQLDQVPAMEIVFGKDKVRKLKVVNAQNIAELWIEGPTVQMKNVGADAFVCIASENRILARNIAGDYVLTTGPFMRRFLDGYFPMQVSLEVDYPDKLLQFDNVTPAELKLHTIGGRGHLKVDTLFEGRLTIALRFTDKKGAPLAKLGAPPRH